MIFQRPNIGLNIEILELLSSLKQDESFVVYHHSAKTVS